MIITEEQQAEMLEAAKPLMKWMSDNCHPMCVAHVEIDTVTLAEDIARTSTMDFIKD